MSCRFLLFILDFEFVLRECDAIPFPLICYTVERTHAISVANVYAERSKRTLWNKSDAIELRTVHLRIFYAKKISKSIVRRIWKLTCTDMFASIWQLARGSYWISFWDKQIQGWWKKFFILKNRCIDFTQNIFYHIQYKLNQNYYDMLWFFKII